MYINYYKELMFRKSRLDILLYYCYPYFISHHEFASVNNALREHNDKKEEIKNLNTSTAYQRFCSIYKTMLSYCSKLQEFTETKNQKL